MKTLAITLGDTTTVVDVVSERPPRWSVKGSEPRVPGELLRELFDEARGAGVPETAFMAPRMSATGDDGRPCEIPLSIMSWCVFASLPEDGHSGD
ncbi:MAG TPA: hypothetical protein VGJ86_02375 [Acidimicrobiales bacterium]